MPDHGDQLGVDLNELYRTAHFLSEVQTDFTQAAVAVDEAFPPDNSGQWTTMVSAWGALRLAIADLLTENAQTIGDTSDTLTAIAQRYADTDLAAALRFTSLEMSDPNEQGW
jgi:hypothetical protein